MSTTQFEVPTAPLPPKTVRITLSATLMAEVESLAKVNGVEPTAVIEHAVTFALATRNSKHTRNKRAVL